MGLLKENPHKEKLETLLKCLSAGKSENTKQISEITNELLKSDSGLDAAKWHEYISSFSSFLCSNKAFDGQNLSENLCQLLFLFDQRRDKNALTEDIDKLIKSGLKPDNIVIAAANRIKNRPLSNCWVEVLWQLYCQNDQSADSVKIYLDFFSSLIKSGQASNVSTVEASSMFLKFVESAASFFEKEGNASASAQVIEAILILSKFALDQDRDKAVKILANQNPFVFDALLDAALDNTNWNEWCRIDWYYFLDNRISESASAPSLVTLLRLHKLRPPAEDKHGILCRAIDRAIIANSIVKTILLENLRINSISLLGSKITETVSRFESYRELKPAIKAWIDDIKQASSNKTSENLVSSMFELLDELQTFANKDLDSAITYQFKEILRSFNITLPDTIGSIINLPEGFSKEFELEAGVKATPGTKVRVLKSRIIKDPCILLRYGYVEIEHGGTKR